MRSSSVPDDRDGTPECDVSTNSLRCPSSMSHITGLFESTVPGNVMVGADTSDARGNGAAADTVVSVERGVTASKLTAAMVEMAEYTGRINLFRSRAWQGGW